MEFCVLLSSVDQMNLIKVAANVKMKEKVRRFFFITEENIYRACECCEHLIAVNKV